MLAKTVKRILPLILAAVVASSLAGCGGRSAEESGVESSAVSGTDTRQEVFSQDEYVLYQNVFHGDYGKQIDGSPVEKEGVFAELYDAYNGKQRYYVWGYYDQTKCCDWQWEFVPREGEELPPVGSRISVTGTFESNGDALDGYWIASAGVTTVTKYTGQAPEIDMCSMSCTLERVQMYNLMYKPEFFEGKEFSAYGRVASPDSLKDPYYDGSWETKIVWDKDIPAIGTVVTVTGKVDGGKLAVGAMKEM